MEELTLEELIRYMVLIQQDSFLFYRKAARILEGSELKTLTEELADFKARQLKQLKELISECTLNQEESDYMIDVDTDLFDEILDNGDIPAQATPRDVLFRSLNRENRIARTYDMILNLPLSEKRAQEVFKLLLDDEIEHIDALRKRVENVRSR
jgi:rubrerythrin